MSCFYPQQQAADGLQPINLLPRRIDPPRPLFTKAIIGELQGRAVEIYLTPTARESNGR